MHVALEAVLKARYGEEGGRIREGVDYRRHGGKRCVISEKG